MASKTYAATSYRNAFEASHGGEDLATVLSASPQCLECQGQRPHIGALQKVISDGDRHRGLLGLICGIPAKANFPRESVVNLQAHVNDGAYAHPCLILMESACGHQVFVAPLTSFGGREIKQKYSNVSKGTADRVFYEYLAIQQPQKGTVPHNGLQTLTTDSHKDLHKQTYAHLDQGFWIEWRNLTKTIIPTRRLTLESNQYVQWAYAVCEIHRLVYGSPSSIPRTPSPTSFSPSRAVPQTSLPAVEMFTPGYMYPLATSLYQPGLPMPVLMPTYACVARYQQAPQVGTPWGGMVYYD